MFPLTAASRLGCVALALLVAAKSFAGDVNAAVAPPPGGGGWAITVAPYFWAAGLDGTLAANGVESSFEADFGDIFKDLDFGMLNALEVRHDRVSLTANVIYIDISAESGRAIGSVLPGAPSGDFSVDTDTQEVIFELVSGYEVASLGLGDEGRVAFDLRGGIRYWWMKSVLEVTLDPGSPLGPFSQKFKSTIDWVDVVVGARIRAQLTPKFGLVIAGDVGGFELGSASDFTWSANGYLVYALGEHWQLAGGWRSLDIEREVVHVRMEGPLIGAFYRF